MSGGAECLAQNASAVATTISAAKTNLFNNSPFAFLCSRNSTNLHVFAKVVELTTAPLPHFEGPSMSQANPSFPGRNVYSSSSKLPDRTALKPGTSVPPQTYSQSTFGRQPGQPYQFGQSTVTQQQHGALGGRQSMEKESNALSELSEEQRDEINEAVWRQTLCHICFQPIDRPIFSFPSLISTEIAIWTTTRSASQ